MDSSLSWYQTIDNESLWNGTCTPENTVLIDVVSVDILLYSRLEIVYISVVLPIVAALAAITNGSYLYVVAKIKSMRTVTNIYLANLAVADMIYSISLCASTFYLYSNSGGVRGNVPVAQNCALLLLFPEICYGASFFLVLAVTVDRFYAVCYPLKHRTFTKARTVKTTIAAWSLGSLLFLQTVLSSVFEHLVCVVWPDLRQYSDLPSVFRLCTGIFTEKVDKLVESLLGIPVFVFTMLANCFMYIKIIKALNNRPAQRDNQRGPSNNAERTRRRVTNMLLANTLVFFMLTLPTHIRLALELMTEYMQLPPALDRLTHSASLTLMASALCFINSMINPIIYNATNSRYRQAYCEAFLPCRRSRTP
ncbi:neuropeptide FF receptor 2-like [Acanthaster planci]|uniref:Neuropeptide FF receptor 2-like n=1 Tax=Acanthaster planci TaxID=133434 RepID=A0A8B7Y959_ACAPL|nr:neuropeptide FF receptor 2-like [Acanthaster planci]